MTIIPLAPQMIKTLLENFDNEYLNTFYTFKTLYPFIIISAMLCVFIFSMKITLYFINKFIISIQYILDALLYLIMLIFCMLVSFVFMDCIAVWIGFNTVTSMFFIDTPIELEVVPNYFMSLSYDTVNILFGYFVK